MKNAKAHQYRGVIPVFAFLLTVTLLLCACAKLPVKNGGARVKSNVARVYEKQTDTSRFVLNAELIEGSITGKAYTSTSADGRTSLAWVGSNTLYFVSESGIKHLATGTNTAEISFNGDICVYFYEGALYLYSNSNDNTVIIDDGLSGVRQISISPKGEQIMFTGIYTHDSETNNTLGDVTKIYTVADGRLVQASESVTSMAISDDGSIIYYMDTINGAFTVSQNGEAHVISSECDAATNYNFTKDLSQVAYNAGGKNMLFDLASKRQTELGGGFGETGKTNVFSISTITLFTYINDVASFYEGLWTERRALQTLGRYVYDIGYIDGNGNVEWLVENADGFKITDKGDTLFWVQGNSLYRMKLSNAKITQLATDAVAFGVTSDGDYVYYISRGTSLYAVKGAGKPKKLDSNVSVIEVINDACAYIRNATDGDTGTGELCCAIGVTVTRIMTGANDIDGRDGMLICYANPVMYLDTPLYDAYYSANGKTYTLLQGGVER